MPPHVHTTIRVGGSAAHRDERRVTPAPRRPSGASTGGRVREPRDHRLAAPADRPRAVRQPCREAGDASACQCTLSSSGPAAHRGSRRFAPAAARHACQRPARHQLRRPALGQRASSRPRCDSVAVKLPKLGARRPICTWWANHPADAHRPRGTGSVFGHPPQSSILPRPSRTLSVDHATVGQRLVNLKGHSPPERSAGALHEKYHPPLRTLTLQSTLLQRVQPKPRLRRVLAPNMLGYTVATQAGDWTKSQAKQTEVQPTPSAAPPPGWVRGGILRASSIHALHAHTSGPSLCAPRAPRACPRSLRSARARRLDLSASCTPSCRIMYTCGRRCCQPSAAIRTPHPRAQAPHHTPPSFSYMALSSRVFLGTRALAAHDEWTGGILLPKTRPRKPQPPRSS
jgi:hypothetical protein